MVGATATFNNAVSVSGTAYFTGKVGVGGVSPSVMLHVQGSSTMGAVKLPNILEPANVTAVNASGTHNYDVASQSVWYFTANASSNWTLNLRGSPGTQLNTIMAVGDVITVVHLVTQGGTAYYNNAVQVDGVAVTPKYQGGSAWTAGNANSIDAYAYTVIKTAASAFTILASQTQFK